LILILINRLPFPFPFPCLRRHGFLPRNLPRRRQPLGGPPSTRKVGRYRRGPPGLRPPRLRTSRSGPRAGGGRQLRRRRPFTEASRRARIRPGDRPRLGRCPRRSLSGWSARRGPVRWRGAFARSGRGQGRGCSRSVLRRRSRRRRRSRKRCRDRSGLSFLRRSPGEVAAATAESNE